MDPRRTILVLAGAAGSFALMLRVGHRNPSVVLMVLFSIWVLSPFAALIFAGRASKSWPVLAQNALLAVTLFVTLGSLAIYADVAFGTPWAKPASGFLMVPLVSWALIAIVILTARFGGRDAR